MFAYRELDDPIECRVENVSVASSSIRDSAHLGSCDPTTAPPQQFVFTN